MQRYNQYSQLSKPSGSWPLILVRNIPRRDEDMKWWICEYHLREQQNKEINEKKIIRGNLRRCEKKAWSFLSESLPHSVVEIMEIYLGCDVYFVWNFLVTCLSFSIRLFLRVVHTCSPNTLAWSGLIVLTWLITSSIVHFMIRCLSLEATPSFSKLMAALSSLRPIIENWLPKGHGNEKGVLCWIALSASVSKKNTLVLS